MFQQKNMSIVNSKLIKNPVQHNNEQLSYHDVISVGFRWWGVILFDAASALPFAAETGSGRKQVHYRAKGATHNSTGDNGPRVCFT